ncbi:MAG TPA: efflux RND transporter periplasmic adaptor subunit, partial [Tepidisphaeraceae bacterium]|nr:efflux RND transporter periplasmic adaptor subunit [Tepidisphaeraceae bacterium]
EKSGADRPAALKAPAAGIVSKIDVQYGQTVPASAPIVEIASSNRIVAQLGIEPEYAGSIHPGDALTLSAVAGSTVGVPATVERIDRVIAPDTRMVNAYVSFPKTAPLMLGSYVRGELAVRSAIGLIVPRDAVLPESDGNVLFTVKDGKAVKHIVDVLLETDEQTVVSAKGLSPGDEAVVVGNYELEDGMAVSAEPIAAPASQPGAEPGATGRRYPADPCSPPTAQVSEYRDLWHPAGAEARS